VLPSTQATTVTADRLHAPVAPLANLMKEAVEVVKPPGQVFRTPPHSSLTEISPWTLTARSADDRYLLVSVVYGSCGGPPVALNIEQSDRSVIIIPLGEPPPSGTICPAQVIAIRLLVDLGSPLGARELLHPEAAFSGKGR
jgi:hypothetical protein